MAKPDPDQRTRTRRAVLSAGAMLALVAAAVLIGLNAFERSAPPPTLELAPQGAVSERAAAPPTTRSLGGVAQTYSPYCETTRGVCTLETAAPVGSACQCDGSEGRIVP